jgi:DNA repair protein RecN (Recombination protein N)
VGKELSDLGLKGAQIQIALQPHGSAPAPAEPSPLSENAAIEEPQDIEARRLLPAELHATGAEAADLLFSANAGVEPRPLRECASGGEISRVMLALKNVLARVSGADRLPVVVFDEIDAGVGGRLGAVLGKKLRELSGVRQVLCITHQPQIAAFAHRQLKVDKKREGSITTASVTTLEGERRVAELATMLRGDSASAHTRKEAEAMLHEAQR